MSLGKKELASLDLGTASKRLSPASKHRKADAPSRLKAAAPAEPKEALVIKKGKGKALGTLDNVVAALAAHKTTDKMLMSLHRVVFGQACRAFHVKTHLRHFSGVVYDVNFDRAKLEQRLEGRDVNTLRAMCSLLCLERGGTRSELIARLAKFLEKPHETDIAPVLKKATGVAKKKKTAAAGRKKDSKKDDKKKKKKKSDVKRPLSSYMFFVRDTRQEMAKAHPKDSVTEIAKRLGEAWKKLSDKTKYEAMAAKDKKRYLKESAK